LTGSGYVQNQKYRTVSSGYFKNLKELPVFMKESLIL